MQLNYSKQIRRAVNLVRRKLGDTAISHHQFKRNYKAAIRRHAISLPLLNSVQDSLLKRLQQDGIVLTRLEDLSDFFSFSPLESAAKLQLNLRSREVNRVGSDPEFIVTLSPGEVLMHSELFTWGLQVALLEVLENYLRLPIAYHGVYYRKDLALPLIARSRLWHTDMEDDHVIKVIIYLNDVDENGGPFEYLPKATSQWIQQQLNYRCGYINVGQVEKLVAQQEWNSCTGPAGTMIIVDSGTLIHRGKVPKRDRYTLFYDYTSCLPRRPYYCKSSLPPAALAAVVQDLSEVQRNAVYWRSHLATNAVDRSEKWYQTYLEV